VDVASQQLDLYQHARVEQALARLSCDGVAYRLLGASGSAKNGKYYGSMRCTKRPWRSASGMA